MVDEDGWERYSTWWEMHRIMEYLGNRRLDEAYEEEEQKLKC